MHNDRKLIDYLNNGANEYRYMLLDPLKRIALWDPLHRDILRESFGDSALCHVLRPDLAWSLEHCPQLLLLASPGQQCDEVIIKRSEDYSRQEVLYEKRYVCGWLRSSLPPDEMAVWLAELNKRFNTGAVVPIFEPLRLDLLRFTASSEALAALLNAVIHWYFMSSAGELVTLSGDGEDEWQLNWGIEQAQIYASDIWRLLTAWKNVAHTLPPDAASRAMKCWSATERVGLHHLSDKLYLALNALTLPVDITRHAAIEALLRQAVENPGLQFIQLIETLPATVWQELDQV